MADFLRSLVEELAPEAEKVGFRLKRNTLLRDHQGVRQTVWYHSRRTPDGLLYTVTMEAMILALVSRGQSHVEPLAEEHWHLRLGEVLPEGRDTWWPLDGGQLQFEVARQQRLFLDVVVPTIDRYATVEYILGEWRSGRCTYISEKQRIDYLGQAEAIGL